MVFQIGQELVARTCFADENYICISNSAKALLFIEQCLKSIDMICTICVNELDIAKKVEICTKKYKFEIQYNRLVKRRRRQNN